MPIKFEDDVPARRNSDPEVLARSSSGVGSERKDRKLKTFAGPSTSDRWEDVMLPAKALAELHEIHERWIAKTTFQEEDTSNSALEASFPKNGDTWIAFADTPTSREKAFKVRKFKCYPADEATEATFKKWSGALVCTKGQKQVGDFTVGQDNCSVSYLFDNWQALCVMDGHGPCGHWPSTRAVRTVPFFLQGAGCATMLKQGQIEAALTRCFKKAQADLEYSARKEHVDIQVAGCTAVCCLYQPKRSAVWVATAGDSRAVLLEPGRGAVRETVDHKPSDEAERARVEASGCEVLTTTYDDGWVEERINIKGKEYPGISMTRSFGDLLVKDYGITAEPSIVEWSLKEFKSPHLFAASDGVWEFLENDQVADTLLSALERGETYQQACNALLAKAREAWKEHEGTYCDDVSMVFMPLIPEAIGASSSASDDTCCAGVQKSCAIL